MSDDMNRSGGPSDTYDLDELLGAYALDAVDPDEQRRVEDYLTINPRAVAEVQQHREVATMLAFTGMDAPDGLWARIERELESTAPAPGPELAKVISMDARPRRRYAAVVPWIVSAAAAAIVAVVAVAVIDPGSGDSDPLDRAFAAAQADRDSVAGVLVTEGSSASAAAVIDQDGHGYLDAAALPALASDRTYQLWGVVADTGDVISLGILGPNPELETFTVESDLVAMAITIEQAPGVISNGNPDGAYVGELS